MGMKNPAGSLREEGEFAGVKTRERSTLSFIMYPPQSHIDRGGQITDVPCVPCLIVLQTLFGAFSANHLKRHESRSLDLFQSSGVSFIGRLEQDANLAVPLYLCASIVNLI